MRSDTERRRARGQAMIEYSVVTYVIACAGLGVMSVPIGVHGSLFKLFWDSLNEFYGSVYYVLQCSIP